MGTSIVQFALADPEGRHFETVEAMVDSGATYTVLPASILERLGVVPHGVRSFVLADYSSVERGFGRTWMRLDGREDISPVVFYRADAQPSPGAVTMEISSLDIDPVNERLIPVDAFMLATGTGSNPQSSNCVNPDKDTKLPLEGEEDITGVTPSAAKLMRIIGSSPPYRMLTSYEIELLRKSVQETAQVVREVSGKEKKP